MKKRISIRGMKLCGVIISLAFGLVAHAGQTQDVIFQAMQDELRRNMTQLEMPGLERPYYVSYTIDDYQNLTIGGTLGTLTQSRLERGRYLTADLRVGDYSLDNSNFISGYYEPGPASYPISPEDDYDAVRNQIYLATDELYKNALKEISKKRAYLQTRVIKDRPDDFLKQPANTYIGPGEAFDIEQSYFEQLVLNSTELFREYPEIISSEIRITVGIDNQYFANSNGSKSLRGDRIYVVDLSMTGRSEDGENIEDGDHIIVKDLKDLPDKVKLSKWVKDNAEKMRRIIAAKTEEGYTGPVIFTDDAAGEFFRQLLVKGISECPAPSYEKEELANRSRGPELANKVRRRVLPDYIDVYDDPTMTKIGGFQLIGNFAVDDAGNPPKRIQLVDHGMLVNLPIGVAPTKLVSEPNGHARGAVGKEVKAELGNVIVESNSTIPFDELRQSMLQMCKDMGLSFGLIIRKLENPDGQLGGSMYFFGQRPEEESALSSPLEVYKIYLDGTEEAIHGLEFSGVTVRALKDILQTSNKQYCHNYLIKNDNEMPVSTICPSILIEEMELKKTEAKTQKPLMLTSPLVKK